MEKIQDVQGVVVVDIKHLERDLVVRVSILIIHEGVQTLKESQERDLGTIVTFRHV